MGVTVAAEGHIQGQSRWLTTARAGVGGLPKRQPHPLKLSPHNSLDTVVKTTMAISNKTIIALALLAIAVAVVAEGACACLRGAGLVLEACVYAWLSSVRPFPRPKNAVEGAGAG